MRFLLPVLLALMLFSGCVQLPGGAKAPSGGTPAGASGAGASPSGDGAAGSQVTPPAEPAGQSGGAAEEQAPAQETGPAQGAQEGGSSTGSQQPSLESQEISFMSGAWKVYGTVYDSSNKAPTKCIILLHGLGQTRDSWPSGFIETLHAQFPDAVVVALDMRGHGKSTNLGTYQSFDAAAYKDMKTDVLNAKPAIESLYPNIAEYYVVGASMGSTAGLYAAVQPQEKKITKLVMISPGMEYQDVSIERPLETYMHDILAVSASGDSYSADAVKEILSIHGSTHTQTKTFSGSEHGTALIDATEGGTPTLTTAIVQFLK